MGNQNKSPITTKTSFQGESSKFLYANAEMQGWRETMEDASFIEIIDIQSTSFLVSGVFDGHGGNVISKFVAANMTNILKTIIEEEKNQVENNFNDDFISNSLIKSFIKIDEMLKNKEIDDFLREAKRKQSDSSQLNFYFSDYNQSKINSQKGKDKSVGISKESTDHDYVSDKYSSSYEEIYDNLHGLSMKDKQENHGNDSITTDSPCNPTNDPVKKRELTAKHMGTTANLVLIDDNYIYCANIGDSMAVMYKNKQAIKLNVEHKTTVLSEKERILQSGMKIINNRVQGRLNLTRAFGDLYFKDSKLKPYEQAVTCYPEIIKKKISPDVEFIIMGCDGIWDCVDFQKICDYISVQLRKGKEAEDLIKEIMDQIISNRKENPIGTDNMTCSLIVFKSYEDFNLKDEGED